MKDNRLVPVAETVWKVLADLWAKKEAQDKAREDGKDVRGSGETSNT